MNTNKCVWFGLAACAVMALCLVTTAARADGIQLDRYSAAELPSDGFTVSRPRDLGDDRWAASLHLEYANDALVIELRPGTTASESAAIVQDHAVAHLVFAYGLADRLVLFAGLDVNLLMSGDSFTLPGVANGEQLADGTGMGDLYLGARYRLLGDNDDFFSLAAQARIGLPVAHWIDASQRFSGNSSVTALPELVAELRPGILVITGNMGVLIRNSVALPNAEEESGIPFGLGVTIPMPLVDGLDGIAELSGATTFGDFFGRESTPLEALFGGKIALGDGWNAGGGAGPGLNRGVGSPDYRVVVMLGYEEPEEVEPPPVGDRDQDGLLDDADECPDDPEDKDRFKDRDGCPDPDNDKDGILDVDDACVMEREDTDGWEDADGCPEPDNEQDGILDVDDECPDEPEDRDRFQDGDGCPDPDNDKDTVLDVDDECPMDSGLPQDQGCPRVRVEDGQIRILDRVEFAVNKDVILSRSEAILEAVRDLLEKHQDIRRVRVEGHTDDVGRDKKNLDLSRRRAASVNRWLTQHGIEGDRLEAWGCGELHPIADNSGDDGRQTNRRVEFHILVPTSGDEAAPIREGCVQSK
jgi:outer membrane protein OmpA-like peptidoglycan-associated protein